MNDPHAKPAKLFIAVFLLMFGGIGLTVLLFLWATPRDAFGAPPLFFRIVGSFIAIGFIAFSGAGISRLFASRAKPVVTRPKSGASSQVIASCPGCGASLDGDADISPSGDVKCTYCNSWYNVRAGR